MLATISFKSVVICKSERIESKSSLIILSASISMSLPLQFIDNWVFVGTFWTHTIRSVSSI